MREARETLLPFRHARGEGAIVFDPAAWPQTPQPEWFDAAYWQDDAHRIGSGGRGAAWRIDAPSGAMLLRHYLRGGLAAKLSRDRYLWRGMQAVRSFGEFRLLQTLRGLGLPVPQPLAAACWREGRRYRAAILLRYLADARSFGQQVIEDAASAPWSAAGTLIARFHRAGLDHADLNAHNLLFDAQGEGWMIDFDKCTLHAGPATAWREANLARLRRSLDKLDGGRQAAVIAAGFAALRDAYQAAMDANAAGHPA